MEHFRLLFFFTAVPTTLLATHAGLWLEASFSTRKVSRPFAHPEASVLATSAIQDLNRPLVKI